MFEKFHNRPMKYKILFGNGVAILLLLLFAFMVYFNMNSLLESSKWVTHTEKVIASGHQLMEGLLDLETGERGYLITGNQTFLEPYQKSLKTFNKKLRETKEFVSDNPEQVQNLKEIERRADQWIQEVAIKAISMRQDIQEGGTELNDLQKLLGKGEGKSILDLIRKVLGGMDSFFSGVGDHEARYLVISIAKDIVDQETGQRGFLITGKENFLEPFHAGHENIDKHLKQLKKKVDSRKDYFPVREQIKILKSLTHDWLSKAAEPEIALRREVNKHVVTLKDINAFVETGIGKNIMDELRKRIHEFIAIEKALMIERRKESERTAQNSIVLVFVGSILSIIIILTLSVWIARSITNPLFRFVNVAKAVSEGDLSQKLNISSKDEIGILARTFDGMTTKLEISKKKLEEQNWIKTNLAEIVGILQGARSLKDATSHLLNELAPLVNIVCGAFFLLDKADHGSSFLRLYGSYGYTVSESTPDHYQLGEGLVGECAVNKESFSLNPAPPGYLNVISGTCSIEPPNIMVVPVLFEKNVVGVIELASLQDFTPSQKELIHQLSLQAGVLINNVRYANRFEELLTEPEKRK